MASLVTWCIAAPGPRDAGPGHCVPDLPGSGAVRTWGPCGCALQRGQGAPTHPSLAPGKESGVGGSTQRRFRGRGCGARAGRECHPGSGHRALTSSEPNVQVLASRAGGPTELGSTGHSAQNPVRGRDTDRKQGGGQEAQLPGANALTGV